MAAVQVEEHAAPAAPHVDRNPSSDWRQWCRLCAKDDVQGNLNVFLKNEDSGEAASMELATAIGKYFWVNVSALLVAPWISTS